MSKRPAPQLKPEAQAILKEIIDESVKSPETAIPGLSVSITNSKGDDLFSYASGYTDASATAKLTEDHIFWIASTTKQVATVAILQLVEEGKLKLDDADQVEQLVPELAKIPIASRAEDGSIKLTPKKNRITLRHLLTHTAGFGYTFFNHLYREYGELYGLDEFNVSTEREIQFPLLFEPGTNWSYGLSIDWAGIVLERYTGEKLGDYIQKNIFEPLNIKDTTFEPNAELRKKLVEVSFRDQKTGKNSVIGHPYKKFFEDGISKFHSGGAGLVSRPNEYIKFLATLLNDGVSPKTGKQILKKETVDLIFENQIANQPDFGRQGIPGSNPLYSNDIPDIYPEEGKPPQGWGLSLFLFSQKGATGHAANTGFWAGITNLYYWIDRESGLAGYVAGQLLPFADPQVLKAWATVESVVYQYSTS
jgi:CubicO group peptidase (beta-lactamase class C family)